MANEAVLLTKEGYNKMKAELDELRIVERPKAAEAIAEARDKGKTVLGIGRLKHGQLCSNRIMA